MHATRICIPTSDAYNINGCVKIVVNNGHNTNPVAYQYAVRLFISYDSGDFISISDCEKYVTKPPRHLDWMTLSEMKKIKRFEYVLMQ